MKTSSTETARPSPPRASGSNLVTRRAVPEDASALWRFVQRDETLESNSPYAYLLLGDHFSETCWVTMDGDELAGFVVGYRPPIRLDVAFVWQVGVGERWRGRGIGGELLYRLVTGCAPGVRFLEATVTPSNTASERLFRGFARRMSATVEVREGYLCSLFPDGRSEPERLFRIGPFQGERE